MFGVNFPPFYSRFTSLFSGIASADINNVIPISCLFPASHYTSLLFYTIAPIFVGLIIFSVFNKFDLIYRNKIFEGFLVLSFLILPNISVKIFSTFFCQDFDDGTR